MAMAGYDKADELVCLLDNEIREYPYNLRLSFALYSNNVIDDLVSMLKDIRKSRENEMEAGE